MTDVMIDFETLGNGKNAAICQIGACFFNRRTGEIGATFKMNIDARSSVESGADLDADTIYWWLSQSPEAIKSITVGSPLENIMLAMNALNVFLAGAKQIWSHATFDFVILQETMKRLKIKPTFKYNAARDIRTLMDLADIPKEQWPKREGTHHDGLDDAIYQVSYCVMALQKLRGDNG